MSRVKTVVQWFNKDGIPTLLADVERINITKGSSSKLNSADIFLKNRLNNRNADGRLYAEHVEPTTGDIKFNEGDTVKIYVVLLEDNRDVNLSSTSDDLIMSAEVQEIATSGGEAGTKIKLACVDKSYTIFNLLWTSNYLEDGAFNTAPLIVKNVVQQASINQTQNKLGFNDKGEEVLNGLGIDARLVSEGGFIEDTRQDDSAFPITTLARVFKPIYEWVDELSSTDHTNDFDGGENPASPPQDRTMLYYVDEKNRFHWFYPKSGTTTQLATAIAAEGGVSTITVDSTTGYDSSGRIQIGKELFDYTSITSTTFTGVKRAVDNTREEAHAVDDTVYTNLVITEGDVSTGNIWLGHKLTKKTFDVVNAVIFNAGDDMNGSGILGLFYDTTTASPKLKMVYKAMTYVARDLKKAELAFATSNNKTSITHVDADEYAFPSGYGDYGSGKALPHWNPGDSTINSDNTFNTAFRNKATDYAKGIAESFTQGRGNPRYRGTISLQFRRFTAGKLVTVTSPSAGLRDVEMRIDKVQYNISKNDSTVTLTLEEDEKKKGT